MQAPLDLPGFRVVRPLARGAAVEQWLADEEGLERRVLIRALSPGVLPSSPLAAALEREAAVRARVAHRGIRRLHRLVRDRDRLALVLEHVDGSPLLERAEGPVPWRAAAALVIELSSAAAAIHAVGYVHRGIRPSAVWITRSGAPLLDGLDDVGSLGVAPSGAAPEPGATEADGFESPESLADAPEDARSDVWALGRLLARLVADGPSPGALRDLCATATRTQPERRPASADDFADRLRAIVGRDDAERARWLAEWAAGRPVSDTAMAGPSAGASTSRRGWLLAIGAVALAAGALGAAAAAALAPVRERPTPPRSSTAVGHLRVVADPWAEVFVDGVHVATTPFAAPVPLAPGPHQVRLEHPKAPPEVRVIDIDAGRTVRLSVVMTLPEAPRPRDFGLPPIAPSSSADVPSP